MIAWTCDPYISGTSSSVATSGTVYLNAVYVPYAVTTTKAWFSISAAGVTPTAGQNYVGLYNSSGTLVASVGVDSSVTATGMQSVTWTSPANLSAGLYWVAMLWNAATTPALARSSTANLAIMNANLSAVTARFCSNGTGKTSLTAITPSSNNTSTAQPIWTAIS
jgi:hypothetical protein